MDKITTIERNLISNKIFNSIEVNNKSQEYYDKLNIINTYYERIDGNIRTFFSTMSEFIPSYINTLVYPDNYQYTNTSNTNKALVEKAISDLYNINNNIKKNIESIQKENKNIELSVNTQSKEHNELLGKYKDNTLINNGSDILFNQSVDLYKIQYLINFFIIIGVITLIISLYQIYKKK
jgi:hypothetical protein